MCLRCPSKYSDDGLSNTPASESRATFAVRRITRFRNQKSGAPRYNRSLNLQRWNFAATYARQSLPSQSFSGEINAVRKAIPWRPIAVRPYRAQRLGQQIFYGNQRAPGFVRG